jgi:hypothetical protein
MTRGTLTRSRCRTESDIPAGARDDDVVGTRSAVLAIRLSERSARPEPPPGAAAARERHMGLAPKVTDPHWQADFAVPPSNWGILGSVLPDITTPIPSGKRSLLGLDCEDPCSP